MIVAVVSWRAVARNQSRFGPAGISLLMLEAAGRGKFAAADDDFAALLCVVHLEFMRETAQYGLRSLFAA